uniref:Transport protein particle subunit trs120 n=1 Tax=Psilocybe cubensis TaxID=181762 RepID=A0A8H8CM97_PSICU
MDTHAFASLAHIRILLIPVGLIPRSSFDVYAEEIRSFDSIRLGEIPTDTRDGRAARFLPNPLSKGNILLSFPTHPPPQSHSLLSLVRPSHFPLAVIGVATCSQSESSKSLYSQFRSSLADIFPSGSTYPLVTNCFAFEDVEGTANLDPGETLPGLVTVPCIKNRKLHIGTLLGVLCSQILTEFGVLVQALETPLGNEYLNASLMPFLPPVAELPSSLNSFSRTESSPSINSHNSSPDISRSSFSLAAAPAIKRNASSANSSTARQSTLGVQAQKKRLSTIGTSSSHGRLYKMLGDFFLLSGRTEDATIWYNEAVQLFKSSHDPLWYACTLEGMATIAIIDAWSVGHGLNNSVTAVKEPWTDVSDRLQQAINLYQKTPAPDGEQMHSLLAYLFCGCVLRQTSLLFSVWSSKGWGPLAFTIMLQSGTKPQLPPTLLSDDRDQWLILERLSSITGISRASISSALSQLHGPWLLHLGQRERISILETMASFYSCLGYHRKEAYILREVLGCILDLMVCGREEDGFSQPTAQSAGLGIHNVHAGAGGNWGTVGVRLSESSAGNESVLRLLKYVCKVLGINLESVGLVEGTKSRESPNPPSLDDYDEDIIEELRQPCGWPELQVGVVREAVAVAEALPDFPTVAQFALSSLKTLQTVLTSGDQYHLYSTASRALVTARRRGDSRAVEYWSGRPIVSMSIAPLPAIRIPVEKPRSIQHKIGDLKPLVQGIVDPFLYNPRKATAGKEKSLVVKNEVLEFVITLQNPYIFDLELQELSLRQVLCTSGVAFESQPLRVVIPANTLHQVVLSGKATDTGTLTIRGCFVQAPGGVVREYILPLYTAQEEERISRKRRAINSENGRSKYAGLDYYHGTKQEKRSSKSPADASGPSFRFLECKVVPEQPLLRIRRSSITHGALMLYDGEKSSIRLTLENVSPITVDFLHCAFEDSTIEPAQKALAEGNLSVSDTYETEFNLIHKPVFSWDQDEAKTIAPNHILTLTVECYGKVGCNNGVIHISYSHAEDPNLHDSDVFYVRQVSYPLMVTVYHMLECNGMDLLQFPSYPLSLLRNNHPKNARMSSLHFEDDTGWCLFSIEVRNTYGSPFDVALIRTQHGESAASSTTTIPPGSVSRLVIPIKKILLEEEQLSKPIPTLSDRQFVLAQSSLSEADQRAQRELFWYREELFKCVRGRWHETGGTRSGELSFRTQRMTLPMLEVFRLEIARVSLSLGSSCDGTTQQQANRNGSRHYPKVNEFVELKATVVNLTPSSLVFTMELEANPSEYIIYEGVLNDLPVGRLESGESREITTSVCFLASGHFEISALVRGFGGATADSRVARAHITAILKDDP